MMSFIFALLMFVTTATFCNMYGLVLDGEITSTRNQFFKILDTFCERVFYSFQKDQLLDPGLNKIDHNQIILALPNTGLIGSLLAAHQLFPTQDLFIASCQFSQVTDECLLNLADHFSVSPIENEIVCYCNNDMKAEPLISIWRPQALARLKHLSDQTLSNLTTVMDPCNLLCINPKQSEWLTNNTLRISKSSLH